jgi:hypothetical protein
MIESIDNEADYSNWYKDNITIIDLLTILNKCHIITYLSN